MTSEADDDATGPASFMIANPDGNTILVDQHVSPHVRMPLLQLDPRLFHQRDPLRGFCLEKFAELSGGHRAWVGTL